MNIRLLVGHFDGLKLEIWDQQGMGGKGGGRGEGRINTAQSFFDRCCPIGGGTISFQALKLDTLWPACLAASGVLPQLSTVWPAWSFLVDKCTDSGCWSTSFLCTQLEIEGL